MSPFLCPLFFAFLCLPQTSDRGTQIAAEQVSLRHADGGCLAQTLYGPALGSPSVCGKIS